ncbi:MAG: response regulator transcription factor, partial [Chitinophagaceae bacterium]|nr:response regulator transcription factor [Chitinophagaceae bacterium]
MEAILVSIVEDIPEIREGLRFLVKQTPGFHCVSAYENAEDAMAGLPGDRPDIVIMDIGLPGDTGVQCLRKIKLQGHTMQFMMFTVYEDSDQVFEALAA